MPTSYAETRDRILEMVENIGRDLQPNEDWQPIVILNTSDKLVIVGFAGGFETKDLMCDAIRSIIIKYRARTAGFVATAFERRIPKTAVLEEQDGPRSRPVGLPEEELEKFPITDEVVNVITADLDNLDGYLASIVRSPDAPPKLKPWQHHKPEGGRFAEALVDGLSKVNVDDLKGEQGND